ncbi:DUF192 domain-containing protein [Pelistega ratti]|uniref:DUF192 domain-containing protein n=1 Tax=Pelistega ratti TaxID=2652177 RepID=UPI00135A8845|nr:DUF192 domain-containing protein [Pelistega ratti]
MTRIALTDPLWEQLLIVLYKFNRMTIIMADSFWQRLRGLIGMPSLPKDKGMYFPRCKIVHTMFMRMPILVVFCNKKGQIIKLIPSVKPWSIAFCFKASGIYEFDARHYEALLQQKDLFSVQKDLQQAIFEYMHTLS